MPSVTNKQFMLSMTTLKIVRLSVVMPNDVAPEYRHTNTDKKTRAFTESAFSTVHDPMKNTKINKNMKFIVSEQTKVLHMLQCKCNILTYSGIFVQIFAANDSIDQNTSVCIEELCFSIPDIVNVISSFLVIAIFQ